MDSNKSAAQELLAMYRAKIDQIRQARPAQTRPAPWEPPPKKRKRINKATIRARRNVRKATAKASKRANRRRAA